MQQIAILGGTFDPIHNGHLKLAEEACAHFPLDACWFMPAAEPPHKQGRKLASYAQRFHMAELATAAYEKFEVSDFEAKRSGLSYTSDTLALLRSEYPDSEFSLILGADSFFEFENWHAPADICRDARLLVAAREYAREHSSLSEHARHLEERFGARVALIPAPLLDISSMHIRELLAAGKKSAAQYLPAAVYRYIQAEGLYGPEKEGKL